jgi:hypothetical protein
MPAREGPENGKAEALPVFSISGGAFSDLRKGHQFPKIRKPTKWPTGGGAFSDQGQSRGKKTIGGVRFERFSTERRFAEVPQVR